ncbi:variant erythrocyte surface antigen-1 family protein [Babesia caballi]|uniref:Variant erythrocyte surface antigen-1 family protein n=1 Tax=Babesia caballi TaxID=5871 RepID=A0AAV4LY25_BABCB|nr:variant erythrocyte surface antigen-1 family protein [Babesia caballi]
MSEPKKLTQQPKNLKEAIDWVIKIKKLSAIDKLAEALEKLLKHDGSEVAVKVLENYRHISESVIKELADANQKMKTPKDRFHFTYTALDNLSHGLNPFPSGSAAISREEAEKWVSSVDGSNLQKLIKTFAGGLESFKSSILQGSNNSAYNSAPSWKTLTDSDKRERAAILLGIMPVVYIGLTYLYWQCAPVQGSPDKDLWAQKNLSQNNDITKYMVAFGHAENDLNTSNNGGTIAAQLQSAFSSELQTAYDSAKPNKSENTSPSYPEFLGKLQETALGSTPSTSTSPLTALYLLSYYYITNSLYTVQPTSPDTPSFAGYSGLTALAGGAYGFNLCGLGTLMGALLT